MFALLLIRLIVLWALGLVGRPGAVSAGGRRLQCLHRVPCSSQLALSHV